MNNNLHFTYQAKAPEGEGWYYHSNPTPIWLGQSDDPAGPFKSLTHALSVALTSELTNALEVTNQ